MKKALTISNRYMTFEDLQKVLIDELPIEIDPNTIKRVEDCHNFLVDFAKDKLIYGINTGFGPMAQYRIEEDAQKQLQFNLIRSHSSGMGEPIKPIFVKALMIARMNSFLRGRSGVHPELIHLLKEFINRDITPVIYEHGGVGASGDLVQLAHLALSLIGEGYVFENGEKKPTHEVMQKHGLEPLNIHLREGLALINGTSAMTGIGVVNLLEGVNLVNWVMAASAIITELVESYDDHFSKELNQVKLHPGQQWVAARLQYLLKGSQLIRKRDEHLYNNKVTDTLLKDKVQEYYSIRCVPQIVGPVHDTIQEAIKVIINEINSVNDNPVIDPTMGNVYHGGNFHGDYVSLEMDKLKVAITKLSILAERQLNFLLNDKLNQRLPPFANLGTLGLNLGMQGSQFVATSTVAENQSLSFPMYVHSIPNNNDNQDVVSMGTNAALMTSKVIENTYQVLAVQMLTVIQAVEYIGCQESMAPQTRQIYDEIRAIVPAFTEDTIMYEKTNAVKDYLKNKRFESKSNLAFSVFKTEVKESFFSDSSELIEVAVV
jgi:histidine ammonia-lyase